MELSWAPASWPWGLIIFFKAQADRWNNLVTYCDACRRWPVCRALMLWAIQAATGMSPWTYVLGVSYPCLGLAFMRSFYEHADEVFSFEVLRRLLAKYQRQIGAFEARINLSFSFPMLQRSLRSGLTGWQYYRVAFEATLDRAGKFRRIVEFDFVYSSTCPCSAELSEHARSTRGAYAIPHAQRSKARVRVVLADKRTLTIEDLQRHCASALKTETQVMVKREDEQAFAELNGTYIKFVEDAARLLHRELAADERILDFQVACSHLESLHSHDAVSVICKGVKDGLRADFSNFQSLVC